MINEFEYKGIWWLPQNPEKRIDGTLTFSSTEGAILNLNGSLGGVPDFKDGSVDIILGNSSQGQAITLHKCLETKSEISLYTGTSVSNIIASMVFAGTHFQRTEDIRFKNLSIQYSHLDDWVGMPGLDVKSLPGGEGLTIRKKVSKLFHASVGDDYEVSINAKITTIPRFPIASFKQKELTVKQKVEIKIEASEEKQLENWWKMMYHIRNFLSLGIGKAIYPLCIEGIAKGSKGWNCPVSISYKLPDLPEKPRKLTSWDMLFIFGDISEKLDSYLKTWLEKAELLGPVYDLYFGTFYNPEMYLQHRFLSLAQAIETYHRRVRGGKYQSDNEYWSGLWQCFIKAIPNTIDRNFKQSLKVRLKYLNEYAIRKRLMEIFKNHEDIASLQICDIAQFAEDVKNTRNYLTHYDESLREKSKDGDELYVMSEKLRFLLEVCLLFELGIPADTIKKLVERNRRYEYLKGGE